MQGETKTSSVGSPTGAPSTAAPSDSVVRPDPGLARGVWEAPPWLFWVFLALVVLGAAAYLLRRLGVLKLGRSFGQTGDDAGPRSRPSSAPRSRRP